MSDHCHHRVLRLRWEPQGTSTSRPDDRRSLAKPVVSRLNRPRMEAETRGGDKPAEVARTLFATDNGEFELRAFEYPSGYVYVVLVKGQLGDGSSVLTRVHSECLTGDALGSRRCDCGLQLRNALAGHRAGGARRARIRDRARRAWSRARQQTARLRPAGERIRHGRCEPSAGLPRRRARLRGGGAMLGARRRPLGAVAHEQSPQGGGPAEKWHRGRRGRLCCRPRRTRGTSRTYGRNRAASVTPPRPWPRRR